MNTRKMVAGLGALGLALICTFALVRFVQGAEERAVAGEELVDVLVVTDDIKAGTVVGDIADRVESKTVQAKVRPEGAVVAFTQIDGLVTSVDLVKGEQLLTSRFINPGAFQGARNASVRIPKGANEVTFKLAPERALGGQLRPGDTVTVLASFVPFDNETLGSAGEIKVQPNSPTASNVLLNKVSVVRIQFPEDANASIKEKNGVGVAPTQDIFVTLAVDQPSLARAVFAAEFGKVWLSYEPADADASGNRSVTRGNVYETTPLRLQAPEPLAVPAATPPSDAPSEQ